MRLVRFMPHLMAAATVFTSAEAFASLAIITTPETVFAWGATAENSSTGQIVNQSHDWAAPTFSTGGAQTAQVGGSSASVNAWADPAQGLFKAINTSYTPDANGSATSYARLDLYDTVTVSGPGTHATLTATLDYETVVSGLGLEAGPPSSAYYRFLQINSWRNIAFSYDEANPAYDPTATCIDYGSDGIYCPSETQPIVTQRFSDGAELSRELALSYSGSVYGNGTLNDGHHTGQLTLSISVPVDVAIDLTYFVFNNTVCINVGFCNLVSDASNSDYIKLSVSDGFTLASANGYRYQGMAAAVPEPATHVLMLAGLAALMGVCARRRA
jgi:hypothetical protein